MAALFVNPQSVASLCAEPRNSHRAAHGISPPAQPGGFYYEVLKSMTRRTAMHCVKRPPGTVGAAATGTEVGSELHLGLSAVACNLVFVPTSDEQAELNQGRCDLEPAYWRAVASGRVELPVPREQ